MGLGALGALPSSLILLGVDMELSMSPYGSSRGTFVGIFSSGWSSVGRISARQVPRDAHLLGGYH